LKNFYRSPFSKWLPQYRTNSTLSNFNDISYVGRLWCPEMIPDIEKCLPVAIFKMAVTIPHKFNIVRFQHPELIPNIEKFLPVAIFKMASQYHKNSTLFDFKGSF
jgi:branched-subunit amino acid transport protein AzlD